jgi:hypothetical protein
MYPSTSSYLVSVWKVDDRVDILLMILRSHLDLFSLFLSEYMLYGSIYCPDKDLECCN